METISSFMDKDHALIEKLWNGFVDSHEGEDSHKEHFDKFYKNFTRHLSLEENFLFPRLDKYLGMKGEPSITVLAKQDHEGLLKLINLMQKNVNLDNHKKVLFYQKNFTKALKKHLKREIEMHYSICDAFILKEEWQEMLKKQRKK